MNSFLVHLRLQWEDAGENGHENEGAFQMESDDEGIAAVGWRDAGRCEE